MKTLAKRWLSRLVWASGYRARESGVRCLCYHSITSEPTQDLGQMTTPVGLFRKQMAFLADNGYRVEHVTTVLRQLSLGKVLASKTLALTFDDGFTDNYRLAYPILREYQFPATVFLIASAVNGEHTKLRSSWKGEYLIWDQIHEMQASGLVQFGCHSSTHRNLRGLPKDALRKEIEEAKWELEEGLKRPVELFAYPFGAYGSWDGAAKASVQRAGFLGAFTTVYGCNTASVDRFLMKRMRVSWVDEVPDFARLLGGAYDWYALVQRLQAVRSNSVGMDPASPGQDFI